MNRDLLERLDKLDYTGLRRWTVNQRSPLTRVLALLGTIAVLSPIALMLVTSAIGSSRAGSFRMDYLIPGELFPLIIVGGGLLTYAARRADRRRRYIGWSFAVAVASLILSQGLAVVTGLASGATPAAGLPWVLVVALLAIYDGAVIALGVGGALLVRDLFTQHPEE